MPAEFQTLSPTIPRPALGHARPERPHHPVPSIGRWRHEANTRVSMMSFSLRAAVLATAVAAGITAAAPSAQAAPFDGSWSVTVQTTRGGCEASYRFGATISNGVVYYAGGGGVSVSGRVSPSGQ